MGIPMPRARVSTPLADPVRLARLRGTGLLGSPREAAFDRLAGLARKVLKAPVGMVSLVDDRHSHVKSCVGLPDLAKAGRVPAAESFCRHVVVTEHPLVVDDARDHELTRDLAIVKSGMALAYAGVPLVLAGGFVAGTLAVADSEPRAWKPGEVDILEDLAACVVTEIEMRADHEARKQSESDPWVEPATLPGTARGQTDLDLGVLRQLTAETGGERNAPLIRDLGSAKALLRRLEAAVDAAQSALTTALPEK